jgi:hypothetical protein
MCLAKMSAQHSNMQNIHDVSVNLQYVLALPNFFILYIYIQILTSAFPFKILYFKIR